MERSITKDIDYLDHLIKKYMSKGNEPQKLYNYTQFQVIRYLFRHENENVCQKDLEAETGLKKASMTGCLDGLEERGMIRRETAQDDRRRNYIRLTDNMKQHEKMIEERGSKLDSLMTKNISENDLEIFSRVIDRITGNILEAENETDI